MASSSRDLAAQNAPLLSDYDGDNAQREIPNGAGEPTQQERPPRPLWTLGLTWSSIILAIISFAFALTVSVMDSSGTPEGYSDYSLRDGLGLIFGVTVAAFIFSTLNVVRLYVSHLPLPTLINLIVDIFLAVYGTAGSVKTLGETFNPYREMCRQPYWYPPTEPHEPIDLGPCYDYAGMITSLAGVAAVAGLLVTIIHFTLFIFRCVKAYQSDIWRNGFRLPAGKLSIELSIKFLKQAEGEGPRLTAAA